MHRVYHTVCDHRQWQRSGCKQTWRGACRSFAELQAVQSALALYSSHSLTRVLVLYTALYMLMQACVLPGCFFLTILGGSLLPLFPATALVATLSAAGCAVNFWTSRWLFASALLRLCPQRIQRFKALIVQHQGSLWSYLIFLRMMPVVPSWLLNLTAPLVNIPFFIFIVTSVIGFLPQVCSSHPAGVQALSPLSPARAGTRLSLTSLT